jgi:hypothetical protein
MNLNKQIIDALIAKTEAGELTWGRSYSDYLMTDNGYSVGMFSLWVPGGYLFSWHSRRLAKAARKQMKDRNRANLTRVLEATD